jgi:hypothetical protein
MNTLENLELGEGERPIITIRDHSGKPMLIETTEDPSTICRRFLASHNSVGNVHSFTKRHLGFGNVYHLETLKHITVLTKPITIHLVNPETKEYFSKKIRPFSKFVLLPRVGHAITGTQDGDIYPQVFQYNPDKNQYRQYDPTDVYDCPIINLETGKRII